MNPNSFPRKLSHSFKDGRPNEGGPRNVFVYYDWGGSAIWKLYPHSRVFVDGRADLYVRDEPHDHTGNGSDDDDDNADPYTSFRRPYAFSRGSATYRPLERVGRPDTACLSLGASLAARFRSAPGNSPILGQFSSSGILPP